MTEAASSSVSRFACIPIEGFCPFEDFPDELLLHIFLNNVFIIGDSTQLALVCKKWRAYAFDPSIGRKFVNILMEYCLIPTNPTLLSRNSWDLIRDVYNSKCEIYLDISASMREREAENSEEEEEDYYLSQIAVSKTFAVLSSCLTFIKEVAFYTFNVKPSDPITFTHKDFLNRKIAFKKYQCEKGTNLSFLHQKITNIAKEKRSLAKRLKHIFLISDLEIDDQDKRASFIELLKAKNKALACRNFNFVLFETKTKEHKEVFKTELDTFVRENKVSYLRIVHDTSFKRASERKRAKNGD